MDSISVAQRGREREEKKDCLSNYYYCYHRKIVDTET